MTKPAIRLVRPLQTEYVTMANIFMTIGKDGIYEIPETKFVDLFMRHSNGAADPMRGKEIYEHLMKEAGLNKKFNCPIDFEGCTKYCGSYGCGG